MTSDLHSQKGSEDGKRAGDSGQEDSYFIEGNIRTPEYQSSTGFVGPKKKKEKENHSAG